MKGLKGWKAERLIVLKCLSFASPYSQEPSCCKDPSFSFKAISNKETIVERLRRGLPFPWRALRDVNSWKPVRRRLRRQNLVVIFLRLLFNRWLWLWFHSVFHHVNLSNVLSNWCLVTYAGFYACICSFLPCAGVHLRRSWKDCDLPGLNDGDTSSSDLALRSR